MNIILFKTMHGSHLYGLNHATSDQDFYTVISRGSRGAKRKYAKQSIKDGIDSMTVDLSTFMYYCEQGVPQALEAMFAPAEAVEVDMIEALRRGYHVNTAKATQRYRRTIRNFAEGDFKKRRHAARLYLNMLEFQKTGRFNPRLNEEEKEYCTFIALRGPDQFGFWLDNALGETDESGVSNER